jgi:hypothetical protein
MPFAVSLARLRASRFGAQAEDLKKIGRDGIVSVEPGCSDASACLCVCTPVIRRDRSPIFQVAYHDASGAQEADNPTFDASAGRSVMTRGQPQSVDQYVPR